MPYRSCRPWRPCCSDAHLFSVLEADLLGNISLSAMTPWTFQQMPRLSLLDVSWNQLFYLPKGIFQGIHHLRRLNLGHCSLHAASMSLSLPRLEDRPESESM